jgi:Lrp/AsnC family transcriptional regulator, leucine-responsive regulatory protein
VAITAVRLGAATCAEPPARAAGSTATAAAASCSAVTATGSLPRSSRACDTVNPAEASWAARTSPSPPRLEPAPRPAAMMVTPASETPNPSQATGRGTPCPSTPASTTTSTGVAPMSSAACVTLVRWMPRFCSSTEPPYPAAPVIRIAGRKLARSLDRLTTVSSAAARANLANASQPGDSQARASLDSGTVVPHKIPAAASAGKTRRLRCVMPSVSPTRTASLELAVFCQLLFSNMAVSLDDIDIMLLTELQADADRTNVELARIVGLSPAATLHRVRRLKQTGVIRVISAQLDAAAAGFPLQLYVTAELGRHDPRSTRVFEDQVRALPQIISADNVTGETDYLLTVVARDVTELQHVLAALAARGGQRMVSYLRLEEIKPPSRLPLRPAQRSDGDENEQPRRRRRPA